MSVLNIQNLSVVRSARTVVDKASLGLKAGELVGLIGPNGAGKSSLLAAVAGTLPFAEGQVEIDGHSLTAMAPRARAKKLAYLPQDRRVDWPVPVEHLVLLGRLPHLGPFRKAAEEDAEAARAALEVVDGWHLRARTATHLSGGELGRVLMARALAVGAPFLLADEPVAALDPQHRLGTMQRLCAHARAGHGVMVVLHDLTLAARYCDRLVVMDGGRVVATGAPEQVLTDSLLADVYGIKAHKMRAEDGTLMLTPWASINPTD